MTTGEYIDTLLDEIETLKRERDLYETEGATLLRIVFDAIETPSYINPWGIFKYLKATYPNRYAKLFKSFNEEA